MKLKLYKVLFCKCLSERIKVISRVSFSLLAIPSKIKFHVSLPFLTFAQGTLALSEDWNQGFIQCIYY